jgi:Ni,Fe-hydrogenase I small subunit
MTITEISILWLTAGLSCDGDTITMTAATRPRLEDLLAGAIMTDYLDLLEAGLLAGRGTAVAGGS